MRKTFFVITALAVLTPSASAALDKSLEPKLLATGYSLSRVANELNLVRNDMMQFSQKLKNLDKQDDLQSCRISSLIENIAIVEIICKDTSIILSTLPHLAADRKLEQYKVLEKHFKEDALKRLYLAYQNTGSVSTNSADKEIIYFVDKAKEEMRTAASLFEEIIDILQSQIMANP